MAVTKIHPIKSTLKQALDYIESPEKTEDKMLVSSFGCSYETADIEFEMLLAQAMQKGNNLAHHLIQSFAPGEATPEQAHEIGRRLADEILQGKYPYVLTTHIDKGHVHNHIIFCAVDMVNCRKYVSNKQSYSFIRRTSDRLCREYGLSVVKPGQDRGQSYAEWDARRRGQSWKAKLKIAIDAAIPQAKDFDDFLRLMERQGYEIRRGKFVSFRAPGQERFTRCKTLGEAYTEEAITERIQGRAIATWKPKARKGISLRIDIENSIKAQQSAGYARWVKIHNLQQAAKTMNFLTEHGIDAYPDLESRVAEISAASEEAAAALKTAERRLGEMAVLIKNVTTYKQTRPVAVEYRRAADKARRLTRECCNNVGGNCLLLDDGEECICVQSISYSLLCRWFRAAVLLLDAVMCAEITKGHDHLKRCCECGASFTPKSNRAKYCPTCAKKMRRRKEAERQRKRYLHQSNAQEKAILHSGIKP